MLPKEGRKEGARGKRLHWLEDGGLVTRDVPLWVLKRWNDTQLTHDLIYCPFRRLVD
jgi:hypothetical protein